MTNFISQISYRVDEDNLDDAIMAANFLADRFIKDGKYIVDETWGPEGLLYLAESSYALLNMYEITRNEYYLNAVRSILEYLKRVQKASGGWALEIGKYGNGKGFSITEDVKRITQEIEDLPPTVGVLRTVSEYYKYSGDDSYLDIGWKAFDYLMEHWDNSYGSFREKENNELMALRSNPRSYHLFSLIGINEWSKEAPKETKKILPKLLSFVKETFESYDEKTMPLVYGLHASVLTQVCSNEYVTKVIKNRIDNHLVYNDTFQIEEIEGGYGHRDGLRGIVVDEAHMRSSAGIAIAMKLYDLKTNSRTYRDTQAYKKISKWIQSMRGEGFYYEYESVNSNGKIGKGSPGQYLPIWWILGKV